VTTTTQRHAAEEDVKGMLGRIGSDRRELTLAREESLALSTLQSNQGMNE
jgi:hypothetical protein